MDHRRKTAQHRAQGKGNPHKLQAEPLSLKGVGPGRTNPRRQHRHHADLADKEDLRDMQALTGELDERDHQAKAQGGNKERGGAFEVIGEGVEAG